MQNHNTGDDKWHQIMQREEPVQCCVINRKATPQQGNDAFTDIRNGREQVGDNGRTPKAHLTPRQNIAHERSCHHQQENNHTKHPQQFTRRFVGPVIKPPEHVEIDDNEEEARRIHMNIANHPSMVHIAHDPFD